MLPAQPPLPTARNLPFQCSVGSQTSISMFESDAGVSTAATRQNAGRVLNPCAAGFAPPAPAPGGTNAPAATVCAEVNLVDGSVRADKPSHVPAAETAAAFSITISSMPHDP